MPSSMEPRSSSPLAHQGRLHLFVTKQSKPIILAQEKRKWTEKLKGGERWTKKIFARSNGTLEGKFFNSLNNKPNRQDLEVVNIATPCQVLYCQISSMILFNSWHWWLTTFDGHYKDYMQLPAIISPWSPAFMYVKHNFYLWTMLDGITKLCRPQALVARMVQLTLLRAHRSTCW